jgi:hypothetical protein
MLDKRISFKNVFRNGRILIPKLYHWQYKIEGSQVLRVDINLAGDWSNAESFLTKIRRDGNITIANVVQCQLKHKDINLKAAIRTSPLNQHKNYRIHFHLSLNCCANQSFNRFFKA